jgi:hypothetical protein
MSQFTMGRAGEVAILQLLEEFGVEDGSVMTMVRHEKPGQPIDMLVRIGSTEKTISFSRDEIAAGLVVIVPKLRRDWLQEFMFSIWSNTCES